MCVCHVGKGKAAKSVVRRLTLRRQDDAWRAIQGLIHFGLRARLSDHGTRFWAVVGPPESTINPEDAPFSNPDAFQLDVARKTVRLPLSFAFVKILVK
jgi:hypothetical protein